MNISEYHRGCIREIARVDGNTEDDQIYAALNIYTTLRLLPDTEIDDILNTLGIQMIRRRYETK